MQSELLRKIDFTFQNHHAYMKVENYHPTINEIIENLFTELEKLSTLLGAQNHPALLHPMKREVSSLPRQKESTRGRFILVTHKTETEIWQRHPILKAQTRPRLFEAPKTNSLFTIFFFFFSWKRFKFYLTESSFITRAKVPFDLPLF